MYPKLISIGSFYLPTYGVLVALGFLAGLAISIRLGRRLGLNAEKVTNLAVYCALGGIVGAKLFMFLFDLGNYVRHPEQIFTIETLQAAGVFHGGFIVALIVALIYMRREKLPALATMDAFAPGIAIGQAIGRLGCFAAGCCWGRECSLPWGVRFRSDAAAPVPLDRPLHPVQLYESAADFVIFAILYRQFGRKHPSGRVIGLYLVLYSTARFIIEFYREHEQALAGPFSLTQWIALGLLLLGIGILLRSRWPAGGLLTTPESSAPEFGTRP
jgi:phosphatidylglycerol:prolipoprotein diacylglycerol transferase